MRAGRRLLSCGLAAGAALIACGAAARLPRAHAAQDGQVAQPADPGPGPRVERAIVPMVGGDTDIGIGVGALGSIARPAPGNQIFRWKLEGAAFVTGRTFDGRLGSPYQDVFLSLTHKDLAGGRVRLELRAAYTRESNLRYYGLGNAAPAPADDVRSRDFYTRMHPAVRARARIRVAGPVHLQLGTMYMHNWLEFERDSAVLRDLATGSPLVRRLLLVDREHGLHLLEAGVIYDSRDDEISPSRGQHHRFELRTSPWRIAAMPYRYTGLSASLSGFVPLGADRVVLAARLVGDVQIGDVPFYELSRFDESSAVGGPRFIRGVPSNRYYGKRKAMSNLELRVAMFEFALGRSRYEVGTTGFFDAGRVWADLDRTDALDGSALGIKYGTGAGLRLQKGKTFVLRADVAWSPDARPIGGYFLAEHIF